MPLAPNRRNDSGNSGFSTPFTNVGLSEALIKSSPEMPIFLACSTIRIAPDPSSGTPAAFAAILYPNGGLPGAPSRRLLNVPAVIAALLATSSM